MSLDELRQRYPRLGFALFALDPSDIVTLEIYDGDEVYSFRGRTAQAAIEAAFPNDPEPLPAPTNVFD